MSQKKLDQQQKSVGRPRQPMTKRDILRVRVDSRLKLEIDEYLYINKLNFANFARLAFEEYLENHKNKTK